MNNANTNICRQDFVWINVFIFLGHTPRSGIADLLDKATHFSTYLQKEDPPITITKTKLDIEHENL